ncbi:hypothetical protein D3C72_1302750 [compost metagenome]
MPHAALPGPGAEGHLRYQLWLDPVAANAARQVVERRGVRHQRVELLAQRAEHRGVEAGADVAGVAQLALRVVHAQQQGAEPAAAALRVGKAADHELLPQRAFELDPRVGARADVGRVVALADHAFQLHAAGGSEHLVRAGLEALAEMEPGRGVGLEQPAQQQPALVQRHGAQVVAGVVGEVEGVELDGVRARGLERVLQRLEVGDALRVHHHDLAVQPAVGQAQRADLRRQGAQLGSPVVALAGEQAHVVAIDPGQHAVAVELDLVLPLAAVGRRFFHQRGELGCQRQRQLGLLGALGQGGEVAGVGLLGGC